MTYKYCIEIILLFFFKVKWVAFHIYNSYMMRISYNEIIFISQIPIFMIFFGTCTIKQRN